MPTASNSAGSWSRPVSSRPTSTSTSRASWTVARPPRGVPATTWSGCPRSSPGSRSRTCTPGRRDAGAVHSQRHDACSNPRGGGPERRPSVLRGARAARDRLCLGRRSGALRLRAGRLDQRAGDRPECRRGARSGGLRGGRRAGYDPDRAGQIRRIFELAREYDRDVDIHLDVGPSADEMDIGLVCELTERHGYGRAGRGGARNEVLAVAARPVAGARGAPRLGRGRGDGAARDRPLRDRPASGPRGGAGRRGRERARRARRELLPLHQQRAESVHALWRLLAHPHREPLRQRRAARNEDELAECFEMLTRRSARLIRCEDYGIAVGRPADLVVWNARSAARRWRPSRSRSPASSAGGGPSAVPGRSSIDPDPDRVASRTRNGLTSPSFPRPGATASHVRTPPTVLPRRHGDASLPRTPCGARTSRRECRVESYYRGSRTVRERWGLFRPLAWWYMRAGGGDREGPGASARPWYPTRATISVRTDRPTLQPESPRRICLSTVLPGLVGEPRTRSAMLGFECGRGAEGRDDNPSLTTTGGQQYR